MAKISKINNGRNEMEITHEDGEIEKLAIPEDKKSPLERKTLVEEAVARRAKRVKAPVPLLRQQKVLYAIMALEALVIVALCVSRMI